MARVELPSCNCASGSRGGRSDDDLIIITKTHISTIVDPVARAHPDMTVSLTYDGCIPTDAVTTTACVPSS